MFASANAGDDPGANPPSSLPSVLTILDFLNLMISIPLQHMLPFLYILKLVYGTFATNISLIESPREGPCG
jgi:hypothetical protein